MATLDAFDLLVIMCKPLREILPPVGLTPTNNGVIISTGMNRITRLSSEQIVLIHARECDIHVAHQCMTYVVQAVPCVVIEEIIFQQILSDHVLPKWCIVLI
jgi:hypothetical protein